MDNDKISLTEGLVGMMFTQDGIDETNAVQKLRTAQANVIANLGVAASGAANFLNKKRYIDVTDGILALASRNGSINLFQ